MDKNDVYKIFFETVNDSCEWSIENDNNYAHYIDGVASMCSNILDALDKKTNGENKNGNSL